MARQQSPAETERTNEVLVGKVGSVHLPLFGAPMEEGTGGAVQHGQGLVTDEARKETQGDLGRQSPVPF